MFTAGFGVSSVKVRKFVLLVAMSERAQSSMFPTKIAIVHTSKVKRQYVKLFNFFKT
jgi:hypothetical protein